MTAGQATSGSAISAVNGLRMPLQFAAGFFFAFRISIVFLAFQSDPTLGGECILVLSGCLLAAALLYTFGDEELSAVTLLRSSTFRWVAAYVALAGVSLLWTQAESKLTTAVYWTGMVIEVATVPLLAKGRYMPQQIDAMLKGFVAGACVVAAIAWLSPTLPDMRIGHEEFMVPNLIGLYCALAFFLAQHLASENVIWRWCSIGLALALLRTISKTSIIAFLIAETFYLLREKQISRATKVKIAAGAAVAVAIFWNILNAYLTIYENESGNAAETLTGRTGIWLVAFSMSLEHPWIGHGLYSFRALMPAFGSFQPWHAHNELLQQFFEFGLLGVAITIGAYVALLRCARRDRERSFGKLAWVIVIFCAIHGFADTANFGLSLPLWLFVALALGLTQRTADAGEALVS